MTTAINYSDTLLCDREVTDIMARFLILASGVAQTDQQEVVMGRIRREIEWMHKGRVSLWFGLFWRAALDEIIASQRTRPGVVTAAPQDESDGMAEAEA